MKIGIIVAMDKELQQLRQLFASADVRIEKCGIGKVNAALGAQRMINEFHPDVIISSGCAGGNGDDVQVQDVVVSSELSYHDVYCGTAVDGSTQYGTYFSLEAVSKYSIFSPECEACALRSKSVLDAIPQSSPLPNGNINSISVVALL